jgi:hypothetical protein
MRHRLAFPLLLAFTLLASAALGAKPALAQEATIVQHRPGPLALVATLGWYSGAAVGGEFRLGPLGLRLTGGGNLTMLTVSDADDHEVDSFHIFATGQGNADLYAYPIRLDNGLELGISAGARYNSLLGVGYGGALEGRRQLGPRTGLSASFGVTVFPDGEDRVIDKKDFPSDVDFNFPLGAGVQSGIQVALTYDLL